MLDVGWSELLVIGVVALIVVGPKDLPVMFRTLGRFTAKARSMAREFQRAMDDAAKQSGVGDALNDVKDMTSKKSLGLDALESAASKFEKWNPAKPAAKPAAVVAAAKPPTASPPADPAPVKPYGPATQALADKRAAEKAARVEASAKQMADAKAGPEATETTAPAKPVRKAVRRSPVKPAAEPAIQPAPKAKAKPRTKKSDTL